MESSQSISQATTASTWHHTIGIARILSGGAFFARKADDLFLVIALTDRPNIPPNLSQPAKTVLKIDSCSGWGVHFVSWGCNYTFFCNLGLKKIYFTALGGAGAPKAPPGYAYAPY